MDLTKEFEKTSAAVFERNITSLVQLAKANGVRVVLVPEAFFLSRSSINPLFEKGVAEHADAMRHVAARQKAVLIDLAKDFPRKTEYYDDGIHMTKEGNQERAKRTAAVLIDEFRGSN